jgi:hypothetical protein
LQRLGGPLELSARARLQIYFTILVYPCKMIME